MAEQQIALYSGGNAMKFPSAPSLGGKTSTGTEGNKPSVKNKDFYDLKGTDLPETIMASPRYTNAYYNLRQAHNDATINFASNFIADGINAGENLNNISSERWKDYTAALYQIRTIENEALRIKSLGEQDQKNFDASELKAMPTGTPLVDGFGDVKKVSSLFNGKNAYNQLRNNPEQAQKWLGMISPEGKVLYRKDELKDLSDGDLQKIMDATSHDYELDKEMRIALQDMLPLGQGWDDAKSVDTNYVMGQLKTMGELAGYTVTGTDGSTKFVNVDEGNLRIMINDLVYNVAQGDAKTMQWVNFEANQKAKYVGNAVKNAPEAIRSRYEQQYSLLEKVRSKIGLQGFEGLYFNQEDILVQVNSSDLSKADKASFGRLLNDEQALTETLLFKDNDGDLLRKELKTHMYKKMVAEDLVEAMKVDADIPIKEDPLKVIDQNIEQLYEGDLSNYPLVVGPNETIEGGARVLVDGISKGSIEINDPSPLAKASIQYLKENPELLKRNEDGTEKSTPQFFFGPDAATRLSPMSLYNANTEIFDKFAKYAAVNPNIIKGVKLTGEYADESMYEEGSLWDDFVGEYNETIWHNGLKTDKGDIPWNELMQTKGFQKWLNENATEEELNNLFSIDNYVGNAVNQKKEFTGSENDLIASINQDQKRSGKKPINWHDWGTSADYVTPKQSFMYEGSREMYEYTNGPNGEIVRQASPIDFSADILAETSFALGIEEGYQDYIYVTTYVALGKDEMENHFVVDKEGEKVSWADIYAKEENSIFSHWKTTQNPAAKKAGSVYIPVDWQKKPYKIAEESKEKFLVPIIIRYKRRDKANIIATNRDEKIKGLNAKTTEGLQQTLGGAIE